MSRELTDYEVYSATWDLQLEMTKTSVGGQSLPQFSPRLASAMRPVLLRARELQEQIARGEVPEGRLSGASDEFGVDEP